MQQVLSFLFLIVFSGIALAQQNPMDYQRWNIFDVNKIRTTFNNTGMLCNGNEQSTALARPPAFEFPALIRT